MQHLEGGDLAGRDVCDDGVRVVTRRWAGAGARRDLDVVVLVHGDDGHDVDVAVVVVVVGEHRDARLRDGGVVVVVVVVALVRDLDLEGRLAARVVVAARGSGALHKVHCVRLGMHGDEASNEPVRRRRHADRRHGDVEVQHADVGAVAGGGRLVAVAQRHDHVLRVVVNVQHHGIARGGARDLHRRRHRARAVNDVRLTVRAGLLVLDARRRRARAAVRDDGAGDGVNARDERRVAVEAGGNRRGARRRRPRRRRWHNRLGGVRAGLVVAAHDGDGVGGAAVDHGRPVRAVVAGEARDDGGRALGRHRRQDRHVGVVARRRPATDEVHGVAGVVVVCGRKIGHDDDGVAVVLHLDRQDGVRDEAVAGGDVSDAVRLGGKGRCVVWDARRGAAHDGRDGDGAARAVDGGGMDHRNAANDAGDDAHAAASVRAVHLERLGVVLGAVGGRAHDDRQRLVADGAVGNDGVAVAGGERRGSRVLADISLRHVSH
mmetsp:Transcript_2130/g.6959  ORF Transcript_2130/g.6959 Transcript_2130/m.6959 type:complete len:490 (-) Transcript_2130:769-2238(-)